MRRIRQHRRDILSRADIPLADGGMPAQQNAELGDVEPRREEPRFPLDFTGLIYKVMYFVTDEMGARLEKDVVRASAEAGIEQEIRFSGPVGGHPRVALGPAGKLVGVTVELGNRTLESTDRSKGELDAALDQAVEQEIGGSREKAIAAFDVEEWHVRCR